MFGLYIVTITFSTGDTYHFEESATKPMLRTINTELEKHDIAITVTKDMFNADECLYLKHDLFSLEVEMELR